MVPPPLADGLPEDLFACGLCFDIALEPTPLPCCGGTLCRTCLEKWVVRNVRLSGVARCPEAGCGQRLPLRLPGKSVTLEKAIEILMPEEVQRRRQDVADDGEEEEAIPGGFALLQVVVASRDLTIGEGQEQQAVVLFGTPGVVVGCSALESERLVVKFDKRNDGSQGCLTVTTSEVVRQLPDSFGVRLGQRVVASRDLMFGPVIGVMFGERGTVLSSQKGDAGEDRITVHFDSRADGSAHNVNCLPSELEPARKLAGGFELAQTVVASRDLFSGSTQMLIVRSGTRGRIMHELNDSRVSVRFEEREDGHQRLVDVVPSEILGAPEH